MRLIIGKIDAASGTRIDPSQKSFCGQITIRAVSSRLLSSPLLSLLIFLFILTFEARWSKKLIEKTPATPKIKPINYSKVRV